MPVVFALLVIFGLAYHDHDKTLCHQHEVCNQTPLPAPSPVPASNDGGG